MTLNLDLIEPDSDLSRGYILGNDATLGGDTFPAGSWVLLPDTADFIERVLVDYAAMPGRFRVQSQEIDFAWRATRATALAAARADGRVKALQEADGTYPLWSVALITGITALLVGTVCFIAGAVAFATTT